MPMQVFLGSSREAARTMRRIAKWLPNGVARMWDARGSFKPGTVTFDELLRHSRTVDGAIFVFAEDDFTLIRSNVYPTTRDNVLFEYGLFVGSLGRNRVRRIAVGNPTCVTDLLGITVIQLPSHAEAKRTVGKQKAHNAKLEIRDWLKGLAPVYLRGLAFDVAKCLAHSTQLDVKTLLENRGPAFMREKISGKIRALCSNKGRFSVPYYSGQFEWVRQQPKKRLLRRVFVARRGSGHGVKFSQGELKGIQMHLNQKHPAIQIRWVYEDDQWLGDAYRDSLGFALFGEKWIVHWGLKSGYCYRDQKDREVGRHLAKRFEALWEHAFHFNPGIVK